MRSVLCLFLIVADASKELHRTRENKKNYFNVQVWWTWIVRQFLWMKNVLHSMSFIHKSCIIQFISRPIIEKQQEKKICRCKRSFWDWEKFFTFLCKQEKDKKKKEKISRNSKNASMSHLKWKILSALKITINRSQECRKHWTNSCFNVVFNPLKLLNLMVRICRSQKFKKFQRSKKEKQFSLVQVRLRWARRQLCVLSFAPVSFTLSEISTNWFDQRK